MTSEESFYRAPESALDRTTPGNARPLEEAIAGKYSFEIGDVLSEAWQLTKGSKSVILGAAAISLAVNMASQMVGVFAEGQSPAIIAVATLASLIPMAFVYTINAGTFYYAIKRAAGDETASFDDVLSCFSMILPICGLTLLMGLFVVLGLLLLILPGLYLAIGYVLAMPLKVERGLGVWESLETSRKTVGTHWLQVTLFSMAVGAVTLIGGVVTLGIGFIWLLPFATLSFGVLYVRIFGYAGRSN